ncbi:MULTISPECIES: hotdog fold domain-containing protein [Actinomycetes]|uniref:hotdog fold domain-containing protein n=1 Tax=Actinomycetes TaxID=1760 RepID=UPI0004BEC35D|nr:MULTISPECIES: hotdog fold domain-containing protein [Actinomycetes]
MTSPVQSPRSSPTYRFRQKLPAGRLGSVLFSIGMCVRVPYFATIVPFVKTMEPGRCEVATPKWFGVHNHLGTFHAIAACNLAEVAMGMLMEATVPSSHRWIPKGMESHYLAKATTGLRAVATLPEPVDFSTVTEGREVPVDIAITDRAGVEVVHCTITTWVTPS